MAEVRAVAIRPSWEKVQRELLSGPNQVLATPATLVSTLTGLRGLVAGLLG
jgi:hypothetical protein